MTLLDRYLLQPLRATGTAAVAELEHITHPLVYAVEQPVTNIIRDSTEAITGIYHVSHGIFQVAPYLVGAWLGWSFFEMYFPSEKRALVNGFSRATKRIRTSAY